MKTIGIILIVLGIAMVIVRGFSVQTEKKVVDAGPIQINKKENKWIGWPTYAGVLMTVAGIAVVLTAKNKAS